MTFDTLLYINNILLTRGLVQGGVEFRASEFHGAVILSAGEGFFYYIFFLFFLDY